MPFCWLISPHIAWVGSECVEVNPIKTYFSFFLLWLTFQPIVHFSLFFQNWNLLRVKKEWVSFFKSLLFSLKSTPIWEPLPYTTGLHDHSNHRPMGVAVGYTHTNVLLSDDQRPSLRTPQITPEYVHALKRECGRQDIFGTIAAGFLNTSLMNGAFIWLSCSFAPSGWFDKFAFNSVIR